MHDFAADFARDGKSLAGLKNLEIRILGAFFCRIV
jgi:hypothetical protein